MHTGTPQSSFPVLPQNSAVQTTRPSKAPLAAPDEWQQISPQKKVYPMIQFQIITNTQQNQCRNGCGNHGNQRRIYIPHPTSCNLRQYACNAQQNAKYNPVHGWCTQYCGKQLSAAASPFACGSNQCQINSKCKNADFAISKAAILESISEPHNAIYNGYAIIPPSKVAVRKGRYLP